MVATEGVRRRPDRVFAELGQRREDAGAPRTPADELLHVGQGVVALLGVHGRRGERGVDVGVEVLEGRREPVEPVAGRLRQGVDGIAAIPARHRALPCGSDGRPERDGSGTGGADALLEDRQGAVDLVGRGDERRDDPCHVGVRAGGEDDELAVERLGDDPSREVGVRRPAVGRAWRDELHRDHAAEPADVADRRVVRLELPQPAGKLRTAGAGVGDEVLVPDDLEGREGGRAGDDVAAVRPAMAFPAGGGPGSRAGR